MKKIFSVFIITIFASYAFAESKPSKSSLEAIIEAMATQYAQSATQTWVIKKMEAEAAKKLGEQFAQQLGESTTNILSVIGLIENVKSYDDAKTEGQKYSAAAHATANAIAMATAPIPVIGLVAQLVVMGQDLMAAFVSKDFILEQARIRADIIRIYKDISDLQTREFDAELKSYKELSNRLMALTVLNQTAIHQHQKLCEKGELDFQTPEACLASLLTIEQLLLKQVQSIRALTHFNGRFINVSSLDTDQDQLKSQLASAEKQLKEVSNSIRYALSQVAFNQVLTIKNSVQQDRILQKCQVSILTLLKDILQSKKDLLDGNEHQLWEQSALEENKLTLQNLTQGICLDYFTTAPDEIKSIATRALHPSEFY